MKRLRKLNIIIGDEDAIINVDNVVDKGGKISKMNFNYLPVSSRSTKSVVSVIFLFTYEFLDGIFVHFMKQLAEFPFFAVASCEELNPN